jgi:hypothetical protein
MPPGKSRPAADPRVMYRVDGGRQQVEKEAEPLAAGLFAIHLDAAGLPEPLFEG